MNRRGFFKTLSAAIAAVLLPIPKFELRDDRTKKPFSPADIDGLTTWVIAETQYIDLQRGHFIDLSGNGNHMPIGVFRDKDTLLVYDRVLSASEMDQCEDYLRRKGRFDSDQ